MSLVGIRDLSLLQTPPADRQPILTYVGEYDERVAVEAIRRELLREGQVFWVHNRVQIDRARRGAAARAGARGAHRRSPTGRWTRARWSRSSSTSGKAATTCWCARRSSSRGIDMPTVNTLVVERADLLGLGQMHQLRGRVGRSGSRAYAYLFHPPDVALTEEAYERLRTIGEATELGSGFKIAMRDLEIRGAGNLLGEAQCGHIAAVGYDLYCQMVTEAVGEMKGEPPARTPASSSSTCRPTPTCPPTTSPRRSCGSRRTAGSPRSPRRTEVDDIRAEWEDRYGPVPPSRRGAAHRRLSARRVPPARPPRRADRARESGAPRPARRSSPARRCGCSASPATRSSKPISSSSSCRSRSDQGSGDVPRHVPPRADPRHLTQ